jgi:hypothetical protein
LTIQLNDLTRRVVKNQAKINGRSYQSQVATSQGHQPRIQTIITANLAMFALVGLLSGLVPAVQPHAIHHRPKSASKRIVNESLRQGHAGRDTTDLSKQEMATNLARAPLSFQPNQGQTDSRVRFLSRANGYSLFLTATGAVFDLPTASASSAERASQSVGTTKSSAAASRVSIEMELVGTEPRSKFEAQNELPGKVNYFIGNDPDKWRTNVPTYQRISQANVYPGINVSYYGSGQEIEYDFVVNPGSAPGMIRLGFKGAKSIQVDKAGDLLLQLKDGVLKQRKPFAYQEIDGRRREVASSYVRLSRREVGFKIGEYDSTLPLVIDPVLLYSTYLGGSGIDEIVRVTTNSSSVFVTGSTESAIAFPATPGAYQTSLAGGVVDAFVARLDLSSTPAFTYITYLGGSGTDRAFGIAADEANNAYIAGDTAGGGFPTTPGSFRSSPLFRTVDGFVTKLNSSGSALVYSTYIGGSQGYDYLRDIDVDASGSAFVTGYTNAIDFPQDESGVTRTTPGGLPHQFRDESDPPDALVLGLNPAGNDLIYTTFLGGPNPSEGDAGLGIAVGLGCQFVTGSTASRTGFPLANAFQTSSGGGLLVDAFVTRLEYVDGQLFLRYSTYLGGNNADQGNDIAVDTTGKVYVIGQTNSANFPTRNAFQPLLRAGTCGISPSTFVCSDVFVVKIDPYLSGNSSFLFGSYLGGREHDLGNGIAVDSANNIYLTGETNSDDFPVRGFIPPPLDSSPLRSDYRGAGDAFITKLRPTGDTYVYVYSAYLGEIFDALTHQRLSREYGKGVATDAAGDAYVVGQTSSNRFNRGSVPFPTYRANGDGFVAKIHESPLDRLMLIRLMIEGLIKDGLLPPDSGQDLLVKWDVLIKQVEKGHIKPAINQVENFIAQVNELIKSGLLPAAQGKILLERANEVLEELNRFEPPKKNPK